MDNPMTVGAMENFTNLEHGVQDNYVAHKD